MELFQIAERLQPFLTAPLSELQLRHISMYMDILLRWNAHMNLTAVREPDQILTRHFCESIFTAQHLFPAGLNDQRPSACPEPNGEGTDDRRLTTDNHLIDLGSGAGFPGLPIKIYHPELRVTLIESNHKKATFLREVVRSLALSDVDVFCGRAESYVGDRAAVVTLRAVERFDDVLPTTAGLVAPAGRLALLIGQSQCARARHLLPDFDWFQPTSIPHSESRVLLVGSRGEP